MLSAVMNSPVNDRCLCAGGWYGRSYQGRGDGQELFRTGRTVDLRHRRRSRTGGCHQNLQQVQFGRSRHGQDRRELVRQLRLSDRGRHSPQILFLGRHPVGIWNITSIRGSASLRNSAGSAPSTSSFSPGD